MQKLVPLLDTLAGTIGDLQVDRMTVLGQSDGHQTGNLAGQLIDYREQIRAATGIDVVELLPKGLASSEPQPSPSLPAP